MNKIVCCLLITLAGLFPAKVNAQKAFDEGTLVYHVTFKNQASATDKSFNGTYTFTVKDKWVRKELKIDGGYDDVVIMNGNDNSIYTLQVVGDKKYAIQHNMEEHLAKQKIYEGFTLTDEPDKKTINGYDAQKAKVTYQDGTSVQLYYTRAWHPVYDRMFDRLPGANFIPLEFDIAEEGKNVTMHFTIAKIESTPVENACFRIPHDYKMVSYSEYKELNK